MISDNDDNFLIKSCVYYCKTAKFHEDEATTDPFNKLTLLRRMTSQLGNLSNLVDDNRVSCDILNENLKNYADLVDEKIGVNNYAESIQALVRYFKNAQCQKWKSGLLGSDCEVFELPLIPKSDSCNDKEMTEENIEFFQKALQNCDKIQPSFGSDTFPAELSTENYTCVPKPSSYFNQKRKNAFPVEGHLDALKSRKLEGTVNWNSLSETDKSPVTNIHRSSFNAVPLAEESPGSCKPIKRPLVNFKTASAELRAQQLKKYGNRVNENTGDTGQQHVKKSLGSRPRPVNSKFVIPVKSNSSNSNGEMVHGDGFGQSSQEECDPRLQHIDPKMIEMIRGEIMDSSNPITWDDIAGLQFAKNTIQEIVVWPMLRPDIFTGLRRPPKGILLFGPPGTGKTLIAKCIASQSKSTFFSISASSLTSKWIGDGEKMVRALFAVARVDQPSVVFIDEIDSLLSKRSDTEHESSRRIKTEFLVQLDGATTGEEDRLLIIGATNRPQELDEAARRRLVKRLYIPLPEHQARIEMITRLMLKERNNLTSDQIQELADLTDGYSGADVKILCQEAALGPIRSISYSQIEHITSEQVRPVTMDDFKNALTRVRSSVSPDDLKCYIDWDKTYGSGSL